MKHPVTITSTKEAACAVMLVEALAHGNRMKQWMRVQGYAVGRGDLRCYSGNVTIEP
jgi:hypothetical protein